MDLMTVISVACKVVSVSKWLYDRYQHFSENDEHRQKVMKLIEELQQTGKQLKDLDLQEFPLQCKNSIDDFNNSINKCQRICDQLDSQGVFTRAICTRSHKIELENLEKELANAQRSIMLAFQIAQLAKTNSVQKTVKECGDRTEAAAIHPSAGVYHGDSSNISRPQCLPIPQVNVDGDLLVVKWSDKTNSNVARYEVRYNDVNNMIVSGTPKKLQTDHDSTFAMKIGPPRITAGQLCTVQVRAANSQGSGEWSEAVVCQYKKGVPNKPKKPRLTVQSPTNIRITVSLLKEDETNGSPVSQCVVEYFAENITSNWERLTCNIKQRYPIPEETNFTINCLTPDTTYIFRVRMVNEVGESEPSEFVQEKTTQCIPGPPQGLRVSSKRSDKSIKIRWKKPAVNPQAVIQYEAEIVAEKSRSQDPRPWSMFKITGCEKLSAKANDLNPNTKYKFRVHAVNNKEQYGDYSDEVIAETRFGEGARVAAAIGAFIGGTVGGPLTGALGFGYMAGDSASDHPDSTVGKVAAGAAAGIGGGVAGAFIGTFGAPFLGGVYSYLAYKKLEGKLDDVSPQSSEDEEESFYVKALKMKLNESKNK